MTTFIDKYELQLVEAAKKTKENNMYNNPTFQDRLRRTVQFVQRHQTLCACAATAVITAKMTHDSDVAAMKNIAAQLLHNEGEKHNLLIDLTSFVDARGLREEFMAWAPNMRRE